MLGCALQSVQHRFDMIFQTVQEVFNLVTDLKSLSRVRDGTRMRSTH